MQKLLVVFVSVVALMGLVVPSSASAVQERSGDRVPHPQPSHHFQNKHNGQQERRGFSELLPVRRGGAKHPQPSHHFNHDARGDIHQERNSDRLARGLPPLPPARRDSAGHPHPSYHFDHKHHGRDDLPPTLRDNVRRPQPSHHFNHDQHDHGDDTHPPVRRDNARRPQPSHHFNFKYHSHGGDDQGENGTPVRRDNARRPQPSHHFNFKYHGHSGDDQGENGTPARRDNARPPQPSHHFNFKYHGHSGDDQGKPDSPTRRDSARYPHPSHHFEHTQGQRHQERNSDRLARGLPPLPPSRRDSARSPQPSNHFKHQGNGDGPDSRIEILDTSGKSLGYLTDFTGSGQDLSVNYNSGTHTLSFHGNNLGEAHFLGASVSNTDLGPNSAAFVYLTNVGAHDHQANANIWSLEGNQLVATWKNSDGTTSPVHFCLNDAGNSVVLAGNPSLLPAGYKEVYFNLDE